jgi:hypothetical protein
MPVELEDQTIVVAANRLNPAIFGEHWLITRGVLPEAELTGQRLCTPVFAVAETDDVQLMVVPERLQVTAKSGGVPIERLATPARVATSHLPETPYLAVGINYKWKVFPEDGESVPDFSRRQFRVPGPFADAVGGDAATWGTQVLLPSHGGHLTVLIRAALEGGRPETPAGYLLAELNYHFDARGDNAVALVAGALGQAEATRGDGERIVTSLL